MKRKKLERLSEQEIDEIVVAQANDNSAWEEPIYVHKPDLSTVQLPSELTARAIFFARLHREKDVAAWLTRIIQERIDLEEAAFTKLKRELTEKTNLKM